IDILGIDEPEDVFSNGQFWYDVRVSETTETGFIIFAGQTSLVGFGGRVRTTFARSSRFALAFEGQLGIFWIAAALPMSLRLTQGIHLYTAPSAGARNASPILLPLGIAFHTTDDYLFMIESSLGMDPHVFEDRWVYTPSLGGALAWKF
ncbi:MAG: hypothetical protein AAFS10_28090, partial [Myxococcota bacterium]